MTVVNKQNSTAGATIGNAAPANASGSLQDDCRPRLQSAVGPHQKTPTGDPGVHKFGPSIFI